MLKLVLFLIPRSSLTASIDYFSPLATDIFLDSTTPRQCFTINIVDDVEIESTESLTVNISIFEDTEMSLNIDPITTTVLIQDNDRKLFSDVYIHTLYNIL